MIDGAIARQERAARAADALVKFTNGDLWSAKDIANRLPELIDAMMAKADGERLSERLAAEQQARDAAARRGTLDDEEVLRAIETLKRMTSQNLVLLQQSPSLSPAVRTALDHVLAGRADAKLAEAQLTNPV